MVEQGAFWNKSGIYKIENTVTKECYIGSAANLSRRKSGHFHQLRRGIHHSAYLQRSYNKHGREAFMFEVIELVDKDKLIERESYWIRRLRPKYNGTLNTTTRLGVKASEATIQKLKAHAARPEVIAAKRAALLGKRRPPEVIAKVSQALTGRKVSEEVRQRLAFYRETMPREWRKGMTGKRHSETTIQRMRDAVTEEERRKRAERTAALWAKRTDEERQYIVEASHSEEATHKRIESLKAAWSDEEQHAKWSEAVKAAWQDEDLRRAKSESMKAMWAERSEEERRAYVEPTLTEEARANRAKASKSMWDNRTDEERQRIMAATQTEEVIRKRGSRIKEARGTEESRQTTSKASKVMWSERSQEECQQYMAATQTDEAKRKRRESLKATWQRKKEAREAGNT